MTKNMIKDKILSRDLIKGDVINDINDLYIFAGCNLVIYTGMTDFSIPKPIKVIENNISVNYWAALKNINGYLKDIRFDHRPYKAEFVNNLSYKQTLSRNKFLFESIFRVNNQIYTIEITTKERGLDDAITQLNKEIGYFRFEADGVTENKLYLNIRHGTFGFSEFF